MLLARPPHRALNDVIELVCAADVRNATHWERVLPTARPQLLVHLHTVAHGATVVFPVDDRTYGMRDGRIRDPFGHLWLIAQVNEHLSEADLQRRT